MKVTAKRKIRYPIALERTYAKEIVAHVSSLMSVVRSYVPKMIQTLLSMTVAFDADENEPEDELSETMGEMGEEVDSLPSMRPQVEKMYDRVDKHAYMELTAVFTSIFGARPISLSSNNFSTNYGASTGLTMETAFQSARERGGISQIVNNENQLENLKRLWVQENLDLIKSIDAETLRKIRETMADMILGTVDRAQLLRDLQKGLIPVIFKKPLDEIEKREKNRAALIGRDQVGKLNGRLTEYYQRQAGIDEYEWNTAGDGRVRASHRALEGRCFKWNEPPDEGHPGQPIQCRCIADPIIDTNKIGFQPKEGNYEIVGEDIASADAAQNFASMQKYFKDTYNVQVDNAVGNLVFKDTKPVFVGLESIFNEFPSVYKELSRIGVARGGVMHMNYQNSASFINFSPQYFNGNTELKRMKMGNKTGFHPKNTYLKETGMHEFGHVIEWYMIRKKSKLSVVSRMNQHEYAKDVISRAVKQLRTTPDGRVNGKPKTIRQFREEVSGYSLKNQGETFAESVADYMANGQNASPLSKEIWKILKEDVT